jgi:hypothetical protein
MYKNMPFYWCIEGLLIIIEMLWRKDALLHGMKKHTTSILDDFLWRKGCSGNAVSVYVQMEEDKWLDIIQLELCEYLALMSVFKFVYILLMKQIWEGGLQN